MKTIKSVAFILPVLFSSLVASEEVQFDSTLGTLRLFSEPLQFIGSVASETSPLTYWVVLYPDDTKGISDVQNHLDNSKSVNYMQNPLTIELRLAGVYLPYSDGAALKSYKESKNKYLEKINENIIGKDFIVACYGYFTSRNIPFCSLTSGDRHDPMVKMISSGLLGVHSAFGSLPEQKHSKYEEAMKQAKQDHEGVWSLSRSVISGFD